MQYHHTVFLMRTDDLTFELDHCCPNAMCRIALRVPNDMDELKTLAARCQTNSWALLNASKHPRAALILADFQVQRGRRE